MDAQNMLARVKDAALRHAEKLATAKMLLGGIERRRS